MGDPVSREKPQLHYAGDFTWNSMSGRSVRLRSVPIQSLSELERARLQEVAFYQLQQDCDLSCPITIPKGSPGMILRHECFPTASPHAQFPTLIDGLIGLM